MLVHGRALAPFENQMALRKLHFPLVPILDSGANAKSNVCWPFSAVALGNLDLWLDAKKITYACERNYGRKWGEQKQMTFYDSLIVPASHRVVDMHRWYSSLIACIWIFMYIFIYIYILNGHSMELVPLWVSALAYKTVIIMHACDTPFTPSPYHRSEVQHWIQLISLSSRGQSE